MKLKARAGLSMPSGYVKKGAEFTVDADKGRELIDRRLAEEVAQPKRSKE